jgi:hypothetical protein
MIDLYVMLTRENKLDAFRWPDRRSLELECFGLHVIVGLR